MTKRIVMTGGGTAGHVTPNIALIPRLRELGYEIYYIGSEPIEEKLIKELGDVPYYRVHSGKLRRYFSLKNFVDPFKTLYGSIECCFLMGKLRPSVAFSKGGFVGVPVVIGAKLRKVPVVLHEADRTIGLANKLSMPFAKVVCTSFEATAGDVPKGKGVFTGAPIRKQLLLGDAARARRAYGIGEDKPVLLSMGGSLGAQAVNALLRAALPELLKQFNVLHLCGRGNLDEALEGTLGYVQLEYASGELPDIFALADVCVSRAGANSVFELLALKLPALLIPLPGASSRGDQILNAEYFRKRGCFDMLEQSEATPSELVKRVAGIYESSAEYKARMAEHSGGDGVQNVVEIIERYS